MNTMTKEEKIAYEWALATPHHSVAADYARVLAKYIQANKDADKHNSNGGK